MEDELFLLQQVVQTFVEERAKALDLVRPNEQLIVTITRQEIRPIMVIIGENALPARLTAGLQLKEKLGLNYNPEDLLRKVEVWSVKDKPDGVSNKTRLLFKRKGLCDLFTIVQKDESLLASEKNVGPKAIGEMNNLLKNLELRFGMKPPLEVVEWCQAYLS